MELVTLQCVLSKVLQEVFAIKAANTTLKDVLHYNKKKTPLELQNFFILLEVYGFQYPINFFEPSITPLSMQRRKSQKDLQLLRLRLKEQLTKLELNTNDCTKSYGSIYEDLQILCLLINKVADYYDSKVDRLGHHSRELANDEIVPLFKTMQEPSEDLVGNLIDLKCGHTQRPSDYESVMFTVHLEAAGFMKGRGSIGSPQRSLFNSNNASPQSIPSIKSRQQKSLTMVKIKTPMPAGSMSAFVDKKQRARSITIPEHKMKLDESSKRLIVPQEE